MPMTRALRRSALVLTGLALPVMVLVAAVPMSASAASVTSERVSGADRFRTAVAVAEQAFPRGASTVVIARGDEFPDALAAGPLAAVLHAPVLLTTSASLPPATRAEITKLGARSAVVVGGSAAVSDQVLTELTTLDVAPERVGGQDRYGTAAAVARKISTVTAAGAGSGALSDALVVTGTRFPDALVAGTVAAALPPRPLLLVRPHGLPSATASAIADLGMARIDVVGGPGAVDDGVLSALRAAGVTATRVAGPDRAATAVAVARRYASSLPSATVTLARDDAFPDALVAAPWSGSQHRALLLTSPDDLPDATIAYLVQRHASSAPVTHVVAVGGAAVVSRDSLTAAVAAAGGRGTDGYRARQAYAAMSDAQRVGQLFLVGVDATSGPTADQLSELKAHGVGSVYLSGRSSAGVSATHRLTASIRSALSASSPAGVGTLVAVDQEGGYVQVLSGPGFSTIPRALTQGTWSSDTLRASAQTWGEQLAAAGVDVNLAPVLGVVPASVGGRNAPIGYYYREFGYTPAVVTRAGGAFIAGMRAAEEEVTAKHFPGLGRADGNTDTTVGVRDTITTRHDAYLQPFAEAVRAGVPFVMVSSATYPRIDAARIATFSPTVITGMLRHDLGFGGVVVSDALTAVALSPWSYGTRAVRFLSAGGDLMLMDGTTPVAPMVAAVQAQQKASAGFAARVHDAVLHVLLAKAHAGLL